MAYRETIINMALVIGAAVLLTLLALRVNAGAELDTIAVLKTGGMTCGDCSARITRALESVRGVAVTEIDTGRGRVVVGFESRKVDPLTLAGKVSSAGFASTVQQVLTPEQFRQMAGRDIGSNKAPSSGCCSRKGGGC